MRLNYSARVIAFSLAISLGSFLAYAQGPGKNPASSQNSATAAKAGKRQPCWQVAGISKSAMEQRKSLQESARSEIRSVCADSSLSPQQKREKIREIHEQTRQKAEALISPQQQEALKSCREERDEGRHMAGGHKGMRHGEGPCGEMPGSGQKPPAPEEEPKQ